MKNVIKNLVVTGALLSTAAANADFMSDINPYIGANYNHVWMKGNNVYGKLFPKSYPGATFYLGTRFHENFAVELGYDVARTKKHNWTQVAGTQFGNIVLPAPSYTGTTKVSRQGGHLDLVGFAKVVENFDLFGSVGFGLVRTKIKFLNITGIPALNNGVLALNSITAGNHKHKGVFRLGLGANYMLTDMVGLQAKVGWETSSNLRVKGDANFMALALPKKGFKDSLTTAAGIFVKM